MLHYSLGFPTRHCFPQRLLLRCSVTRTCLGPVSKIGSRSFPCDFKSLLDWRRVAEFLFVEHFCCCEYWSDSFQAARMPGMIICPQSSISPGSSARQGLDRVLQNVSSAQQQEGINSFEKHWVLLSTSYQYLFSTNIHLILLYGTRDCTVS